MAMASDNRVARVKDYYRYIEVDTSKRRVIATIEFVDFDGEDYAEGECENIDIPDPEPDGNSPLYASQLLIVDLFCNIIGVVVTSSADDDDEFEGENEDDIISPSLSAALAVSDAEQEKLSLKLAADFRAQAPDLAELAEA